MATALLDQGTGENSSENDFITNLNESYVADFGFELASPVSAVRRATDSAMNPTSILYKSTAGCYRPVSYPDGPIMARCRFIKNAYWEARPRSIVLRTNQRKHGVNSNCSGLRTCKRGVIDNYGLFFLSLNRNVCCVYSLEAPLRGASHHENMPIYF